MNTQEVQEIIQRHLNYLAQDNTNFNLMLRISDAYRQLNNWELAQRYLDDAKQSSGQKFLTEQGLLYLDSSQHELAKEALTQALKELETPEHRFNLGYCLYLNHDFDSALSVLNASSETEPRHENELLKAQILHHLQRQDEAIVLLEQLIIHNNSSAETAGLLALLYFDQNNIERAELLSNKALAINPENSEGQIVSVLLKAMRNEAQVTEIEYLLTSNPNECRLWFALGTTQMQHMNVTAAEKAFAIATQIWPNFYDSWISAGWCHLLQNNLDKAEAAYQQAVNIDADNADGWGGLALVSALRNNMDQANEWLEKTLILDAHCFLGSVTQIIIANQQDPKQAAKLFNSTFPEAGTEINWMLAEAIMATNTEDRVIH